MEYNIYSKYYIRKVNGGYSPCIPGNNKYDLRPFDGSVLPNCVGWATGRFNEKLNLGECKYLGNRNAVDFTKFVSLQGLSSGQIPRVGACMVWGHGEGHVAIVEQVISDTEVITSESGWSYKSQPIVREIRRTKGAGGRWGYNYDFLMFIYPPEEPKPEPEIYIVKRGDTLTKISKMFNVSVSDLVKWNNIKNPNLIITGQKLIVSNPGIIYYVVKKGDNLSKIARVYGVTVKNILSWNPDIKNPNLIYPGQIIRIGG